MTLLDRSTSSSTLASHIVVSPPSPTPSDPSNDGNRKLKKVATEPPVQTGQQWASSSSLSSSTGSNADGARDREVKQPQSDMRDAPSPPLTSEHDQQAYTSLHPQGTSRRNQGTPEPNSRQQAEDVNASAASRTLNSIKNKLKAPSTTRKSKTEMPYSLAQVESVLGGRRSGKGGLAPETTSQRSGSSGGVANALMQRGPPPDTPRFNASAEAEGPQDSQMTRKDVKQEIADQQQRLQDLDQAQTEGLLRTQQAAGIEPCSTPPSQSQSQVPKVSNLVGLPLFKKNETDQNQASMAKESEQKSGTWTSKLLTKIPIKEFPLQGSGRESEFNQERPLWARQPWKYAYFAWFGLSVGLFYLPWWAVASLPRSGRGREDWSWKRATLVKLYRHGTKITFRTRTSLGRDLGKEVPHNKTVRSKFCWVDPVSDSDLCGELLRAMKIQRIQAVRTCGFWYGETQTRDSKASAKRRKADNNVGEDYSGVGRPAEPGEKVLLHLHGGAYWIGTAHEKDVSSAVNTQVLHYMNEIYQRKERNEQAGKKDSPTNSSGTAGGKLVRTFSLDYRLCVPGRPQAGSYPAALLDALSGYLYLVRKLGFQPENIIVAGDSSGGNLAVALCRYLRDEKVEAVPGSLLLMSPWVDVSRSHSGPTGLPNRDSSVYTNQKSDILSPSLAFRNTAVSAFLGDLPARDTYRNPYISPASLQLPIEYGGSAPDWGFDGFPSRIYVTTGSAEISYDQHLTIAHRMAEGTRRGKPVYAGDKLSRDKGTRQLAERRNVPRPKDLLCAEGMNMTATPAAEVAHFQFVASNSDVTANVVIDGEPRSPQSEHPSMGNGVADKLKAKPQNRDRVVYLDEVKDAVHDYLLFKWFEPERSTTWRRIADWIDQSDDSAVTSGAAQTT